MLESLTTQLSQGLPLSDAQVASAILDLIEENVAPAVKADFLIALARKGETIGEIAAFARELRTRSVQPPLDPKTRAGEILDVCGTGGDHLGTFNISTTVALLVASAGVAVAKHGNRAVTSQSGSADVLDALGIQTNLDPADAARWLRDHHFAFFFAPKFHPAFKHIAPARKLCAASGQRTIFNFLGPLLNPARPSAQLVGVPQAGWCEPMARVLQMHGVRRAMVVCGQIRNSGIKTEHVNLDELSTLGPNHIAEFYQDRAFSTSFLSPEHFPLRPATLSDLAGGDAIANARITDAILRGPERGPKRDAVLLNAAAALFVAGKVRSMSEGWDLGRELLDRGNAAAKLDELKGAR